MMSASYDPRVFICPDEAAARGIILTPEQGLTPDERWQEETAWLMEHIAFAAGLVIDYGCGLGRLAREIPRPVLGVDISSTMRAMSETYVRRAEFAAVNPIMLNALVDAGLRATGALAVWVLQHVAEPTFDCHLLASALSPGATLYTVNRNHRAVPVRMPDGQFLWGEDGRDIPAELLAVGFECIGCQEMPERLCAPGASLRRYIRR